jgi:hypothetical protein
LVDAIEIIEKRATALDNLWTGDKQGRYRQDSFVMEFGGVSVDFEDEARNEVDVRKGPEKVTRPLIGSLCSPMPSCPFGRATNMIAVLAGENTPIAHSEFPSFLERWR